MNNDKTDKAMIKFLKEETNEASKLKDVTWEHIHDELFSTKQVKFNKTVKRTAQIIVAAVAIVMLMIGVSSTTGEAMINNLRDMFVNKKEVEIDIEGEKEQSHVELKTNEELNYIIYVDEERYKLIEGEGSQKIVPKQEWDDEYPEVSMEIVQLENSKSSATVQQVKKEISNLDMEITREKFVSSPLKATMISAIGKDDAGTEGKIGSLGDTPVRNYYITNDEQGQLFLIRVIYFLEAAEGHGSRFYHMLESFEIVN